MLPLLKGYVHRLFLLEEKRMLHNSLRSVENTDLFASTPLTLEASLLNVLPIPCT